MKKFFLRPDWPLFDRLLFQTLLSLSLLAFGFYLFAILHEDSFVFPLSTELIPDIEKLKLFGFLTLFGDFSPEVNSIITFQKYKTDAFVMPLVAGIIFQLIFFITISIITAIIIRLSKWWFFLGLSLIILFLVSMNLQEFGIIADFKDYFLYLCIIFATASVYLLHNNFFEKSFSFHFAASAGIWGIIFLSIILFGNGDHMLFQLSNASLAGSFFIAIVFITLIAHEPVHIFFVMISYSSNQYSRKRMLNFILISILYVGNVALVYMRNINLIDWEILYSPFQILVFFAIITGFYGFPKRFNSYKLFNSGSASVILYMVLVLFCISFMSYAEFSGNDIIIEILEDVTIYSQIGMGTIFFFYLVINFGDILVKNAKAYKVVFKPGRFPIATAFVGGAIIMLAMFMRGNMFPYYQIRGAIYTGMADNYAVNKEMKMAEVFYEEASIFAYANQRSNSNLAEIYKKRGDRQNTVLSLKRAVMKNPIPANYIEMASQFELNDKYFDAVFSLQEGIRKFPESEAIANNLALLYTRVNVYDSAFIYFNKADQLSRERNLSALLSKSAYFNPDSLPPLSFNDLAEITNRITIFSKAKFEFAEMEKPDFLKDSVISFDEYAYFYNLNLNKIIAGGKIDSAGIEILLEKPISDNLRRDLYLIRGLNHYFKNELAEAVSDFENCVNFSGMTTAVFADLTATLLWAKQLYTPAETLMERAAGVRYGKSPLKLLALNLESDNLEMAEEQMQSSFLKTMLPDSISRKWEVIISGNFNLNDIKEDPEQIRYMAFKFHPEKWTTEEMNSFPSNFRNDIFKAIIAENVLRYKLKQNPKEASDFYAIWKSKLQNSQLLDNLYLRYLYQNKRNEEFLAVNPGISQSSANKYLFAAWNAKLLNNESDYLINAAKAVEFMGYDPEVILLKLELMHKNGTDEMQIYNEIVSQIQVYPNNLELKKAYVLQAHRLGLESYARNEMDTLKEMMDANAFESFKKEYDELRTSLNEEDAW